MAERERSGRTRAVKQGGGGRRRIAAPPIPATPVARHETADFQEGQTVRLLIKSRTEIGFTAIIDDGPEGLLYKNEIFQDLRKGQEVAGFIKKVREDGKIDLCLQRPGVEKVDDLTGEILESLKVHGGFLPITDKSEPEIIYRLFRVSKKTYKKAIGTLYRQRLVGIEDGGIRLLNE